MLNNKHPLIVEVTRGDFVESQHQVIVSVIDDRGVAVGHYGNPEMATMPRSAIKFLQAIPFVETEAFDFFKLDEKHLAMACASHEGEKQHILLIHEWMTKLGIVESNFCCGGHWPSHVPTAHEMIRKGLQPTPIINNCSGKHMGILTTILHKKEKLADYGHFDHPAMARIRKVMTEMTKLDHDKLPWGVDGCGIPTSACTLQGMATGMAAMISQRQSLERRKACERILNAVKRHSFFIGGSEDFSSRIISGSEGKAIVKTGAEGVFCAVLPEKGIGFALKAIDGGTRAAEVACAYLLKELGALTETQYSTLAMFTKPSVKNWKGEKVGEIRVQGKGS